MYTCINICAYECIYYLYTTQIDRYVYVICAWWLTERSVSGSLYIHQDG